MSLSNERRPVMLVCFYRASRACYSARDPNATWPMNLTPTFRLKPTHPIHRFFFIRSRLLQTRRPIHPPPWIQPPEHTDHRISLLQLLGAHLGSGENLFCDSLSPSPSNASIFRRCVATSTLLHIIFHFRKSLTFSTRVCICSMLFYSWRASYCS